ncbi:MAG: hypothetical protein ABII01_02065 [Candidatus Woesearchaeota archaeon]
MLDYIITAFISFSGLIVGILLINFSKEERDPGLKYFKLMQILLITISFIIIFYWLNLNVILNSMISLIILIILFGIKPQMRSIFAYPFLGVLFYLSYANKEIFIIQSSLIYLIGFPTSAILVSFEKKDWIKIILTHMTFLIIAIILLLLR